MSQDTFQLAYDGSALADGMDVYELAPALLSLGDLIRDVNRFLNQDRTSVAVEVQSDFRRGSFEISILLDQSIVEGAKQVLFGANLIDAKGLVELLFGAKVIASGGLVYGLLKVY